MHIQDKVVLITGASEGIGAACAAAFRSRGARLSLTSRSAEKLSGIARPGDLVLPADLLAAEAPAHLIEETVRHFGRLDVLLNNAGAGLYTPGHSGSPELTRRLFDLNLFAPLELIRLAVPYMKTQGGGALVNVSSIAGIVALPWFTMYSATKSALLAMTDGLRIELKGSGIHVMGVCPGYVRTNFQANLIGGEVPPALKTVKQRWSVSPAQCAEAILKGLERNARTVVTPATGWILIALARLFPGISDRQLEAIWLSQTGTIPQGSYES